jgi:hypothetical protein
MRKEAAQRFGQLIEVAKISLIFSGDTGVRLE